MFVNRGTRLNMPKMSQADHEDMEEGAVVYTDDQLSLMEHIFKSEDGNLLTAFYLGVYCGLRISECFGLRWECVDWKDGTITVNRQMQYHDGVIKLCAVKTLTSVRKVMMPSFLQDHLDGLYQEQRENMARYGRAYRNTERVYDEVRKVWIEGGDFINRKTNGELLTVNSMKYWSKKIKEKENIDFLYHNLRHTYATNCALNNVNLQWLMSALGHKKIETTRRYYINADNETLRKKTLRIIDEMYDFHDRMVEFDYGQPDYYETISSRGGKTRYPVEKPIRGKPRIDNPAADMLREYGKRRAAELQQQPQVEPSQTKKKRK